MGDWGRRASWLHALGVVLLVSACAAPSVRRDAGIAHNGHVYVAGSPAADAASMLELRRAVSLAAARIEPVTAVQPTTFRATQVASGFGVRFEAGGIVAHPAGGPSGWQWRMALAAVGRDDVPPDVGSADLVLTGERLEYRRRELTEWYRNDPGRLEQGFTLAARPAGGDAGQPLRLLLAVDSDLTAHLDEAAQAVTWKDALGAAWLRYHGLRAFDAQGQEIPSRLALWSGGVALEVFDGSAQYPLTIDPWLEQGHPIASDGIGGDSFGWSVAISGDTAIVGARGFGGNPGWAYVFTRSGSTWTQQQKLTASDGAANDQFGYSVGISGNTAIIGAPRHTVGVNAGQGTAYVFTRSGVTWTEQQKLTASDGAAHDGFGWSVAISNDTAVVGAVADTIGANNSQGSAYAFTRSGGIWTEQQKLTASDGTSLDQFGVSAALSGDTAVIGASGDSVAPFDFRGSAYVFTRSGTTWTQQQKLTASDSGSGDQFGNSVGVAGDTAIVGALADDVGGNTDQGSAYVFTRSGTTWTQQQKLLASDGGVQDQFGWSVGISGDTAIVGTPFTLFHTGSFEPGAAYIFTRSGGTWTEDQKLLASDGADDDHFGISVAISGDTAIVGAWSDDVGANNAQGSAYVFVAVTATVTPTPTITLTPTSTLTPGPSSTPTLTPTPTPTPLPQPDDDDDTGSKREKLTEEERRQQQHTNASNQDQYHTEGNVVDVARVAEGGVLLVTIALGRGETLVLEIACSPVGCPDIQVGDYVSADGEQGGRDEAGHFLVDDITATRAGRRVR